MTRGGTKRCFLALPVDDVARADIADAMRGVRVDGMRSIPPANLHVTLKFLGDVDDPHLPAVIHAMHDAAAGVEPFDLESIGFTYFPNERRARVLALLFDQPLALSRLVTQTEAVCEAIGFMREGRPFHSHVTVGRFKRPPRRVPPPESIAIEPTGFVVDRVVLYESVLSAGGAEYVKLADAPLGG